MSLQADREEYITQEDDGKKKKLYIYRYLKKSQRPLHLQLNLIMS